MIYTSFRRLCRKLCNSSFVNFLPLCPPATLISFSGTKIMSPITELIKELFPDPSSPIMHTNSPFFTLKSISLKASYDCMLSFLLQSTPQLKFPFIEMAILSSKTCSTTFIYYSSALRNSFILFMDSTRPCMPTWT